MLSPDKSLLTSKATNSSARNSNRACRCCEIPLTGPAHHTLCRPCWHWQHHAKAIRMDARHFREGARS